MYQGVIQRPGGLEAMTNLEGPHIDRLSDLARAADTLVVLMARADLTEVAAVLDRVGGSARGRTDQQRNAAGSALYYRTS